jgi:hypothetical protein
MFQFLASEWWLVLQNQISQKLQHIFSPAENTLQVLIDVGRGQSGLNVFGPTEKVCTYS